MTEKEKRKAIIIDYVMTLLTKDMTRSVQEKACEALRRSSAITPGGVDPTLVDQARELGVDTRQLESDARYAIEEALSDWGQAARENPPKLPKLESGVLKHG